MTFGAALFSLPLPVHRLESCSALHMSACTKHMQLAAGCKGNASACTSL